MGQKVHPYGFRLGYNKNWQSRWFSKKDYPAFVYEDHEVRKYVKKLLYSAGISKIEIERAGGKIRLILSTARPGIVIGRKGVEIEKLRNDLRAKFGREFSLEVNEIRRPEVDSQLVAENIAQQLERRVAFRRAMKRTVTMARKFGAEGIKVTCSGRLAGAEIARTEWYRDGRVPLQTLRADIDYGFAEAATTFGRIGVKVWIYKGEVLTQTLRTTPRTLDTTKPYEERRERRPRRDGDRRPRRDGQGFQRRDGQNGFNRNGGRPQGDRPQGGFRKPAENKEGGAH
mgnify:CR=1 FL=1